MAVNPRDYEVNFEAMKAGLSQTRSGCFLRLEIDHTQLPPEVSEAPMKQRWFVVLVPMPDDLPEPSQRQISDGDRAIRMAGMMCKDRNFQRWLGAHDEEAAANAIRKRLGIKSRSELKTNPGARAELDKIAADYFDQEPISL